MKNTSFVGLIAAPLMVFALSLPAWADSTATTPCKDGTTSTSTGKGTCSGHGGIQKAAGATAGSAAPATAPAPAAAPATPAAATKAAPAAAAPAAAAPAQPKAATASKTAPTAAAGNTDPTGATAKCKDGTYSKSQHHSGTCSSHGGVAEWLKAQ